MPLWHLWPRSHRTIANQTASSAIMPDLAEASSSGIPSRDGPLTRFTLDNIFYQEYLTESRSCPKWIHRYPRPPICPRLLELAFANTFSKRTNEKGRLLEGVWVGLEFDRDADSRARYFIDAKDAHLYGVQGVASSNLVTPTISKSKA
jgi:hypothetical protein